MKIASGYAEMFEWEDGNPNKEDRTGLTVALYNGDKIRVAQTNDVPIGVIGGDNTSVAAISNASPQESVSAILGQPFGNAIKNPVLAGFKVLFLCHIIFETRL